MGRWNKSWISCINIELLYISYIRIFPSLNIFMCNISFKKIVQWEQCNISLHVVELDSACLSG